MLQDLLKKVVKLEKAVSLVTSWKAQGGRVVWTNGVFDLLHQGHIEYLCEARALGDHLVVGVNTDASVRRLKGPSRPIHDQNSRALQLAAMQAVDLVILFEGDTPLPEIESIQPDYLVKGGDYNPEQIVGRNFVKGHGGQVVVIPFVDGFSTSRIIEKIKKLNL
ncbi:MAG: D-glycero-beta-D-manno-heptose 1-phosphate adenylyltransferase [Saprospiraceae bacterium]|nr:D-glycero-beta-D-manno-heptose 1-phosphate adenylyltransferase [Saprospiraceae bacterium]